MANLFDENGNAEIEILADAWEEQQEILQEIGNFEIGNEVIICDSGSAAAALWGVGIHTVEDFINDEILVRTWNGRTTARFKRDEIEKFF